MSQPGHFIHPSGSFRKSTFFYTLWPIELKCYMSQYKKICHQCSKPENNPEHDKLIRILKRDPYDTVYNQYKQFLGARSEFDFDKYGWTEAEWIEENIIKIKNRLNSY